MSCGSSVRFSPSSETFPVTYVTVSGLAPLTEYVFQVYSENGVSRVSHRLLFVNPQLLCFVGRYQGCGSGPFSAGSGSSKLEF